MRCSNLSPIKNSDRGRRISITDRKKGGGGGVKSKGDDLYDVGAKGKAQRGRESNAIREYPLSRDGRKIVLHGGPTQGSSTKTGSYERKERKRNCVEGEKLRRKIKI